MKGQSSIYFRAPSHPGLESGSSPDLINTAAIKAQLLQQLGIDVLIYHSLLPRLLNVLPPVRGRVFAGSFRVQEVFIDLIILWL